METRVQKYKLYREQIINESVFLDSIFNESQEIQKYKKRINNINDSILDNLNINSNKILNPVIINKNDQLVTCRNIIKISEIIYSENLNKIIQEINELNNSVYDDSILKKGKISENWMNQKNEYKTLKSFDKVINSTKEKWTNFQTNFYKKDNVDSDIDSATELIKKIELNSVQKIDEQMLKKYSKKSVNKKIFSISLFFVCFLYVVTCIIFLIHLIIN